MNGWIVIRFKDKEPKEIFIGVRTPFYAIDEERLIHNGKIIKDILVGIGEMVATILGAKKK